MSLDSEIMQMTAVEIYQEDTLYGIYSSGDQLETARLKAMVALRAKELNIEKEFKTLIKTFDEVYRKSAIEYTKAHANDSRTVNIDYDGRGQPMQTIENFLNIIRNDEYFKNLKFNLLTYAPEKVINGEIEQWEDADDSDIRNYIEKTYKIHNEKKLDDALRIVFRERSYHPIRDIVNSLIWDRQPRIENLFIKWLGCSDNDYIRECTRLIFAGGINRLYNPGCKYDDVIVLIGKQGAGKSAFVRWLAIQDKYFAEITEIEGQKGIEAVEGAWICEIAELLALTKTKDVEAVKSYITKQADRYRKPFDRRVSTHQRQCILIGTTNKKQFLTDKTSNRRFYPVEVNQTGYFLFDNIDKIQADILQAWAEAKYLYDHKQLRPYANQDLIKEIQKYQSMASEDDYRDGLVIDYLDGKEEVCILEIWKEALGNHQSSLTKKDSNDIALIIQSLDEWKPNGTKRYHDYGVQRVWRFDNGDQEQMPFDDGFDIKI